MRILDISVEVSPATLVWPGDPAPFFELVSSIERGDLYNLTQMRISAHTGTHIDAPSHFIAGGRTAEATPLEALIGPCLVLDFSSRAAFGNDATDCLPVRDTVCDISAGDLEEARIPTGTARLLIKTDNSRGARNTVPDAEQKPYPTQIPTALDDSACEWIARRGIRLVGIDGPSISSCSRPMKGHIALLEEGLVILENLDLSSVAGGGYTLLCLPLRLAGCEGAPARAVLVAKD